jgi:class 3 adenylate cyclase
MGASPVPLLVGLDDQPDHPLRAARAGVAMRDVTEALAAEHPAWPRFRIGVYTGPAVIGNVGAGEQRSFAALGDTTNVAARLQSAARPGQVLASEETRERAGKGVVAAPVGPLELKGKEHPVRAYELVTLPA